jgi:DNA-binding MarR family transcriptional regulator
MKNYVRTKTSLSERDEDVVVDVFRSVMRARHLLQEKASAVADSVGLHAAELNALDILGKFGPISMGRLSRETFISPSNTTNTVKKLEKAALVKRQRSNNSDREVTVSLTAKGKALFRKCYPRILGDVQSHLTERLTKSEIAAMARALSKLAKQ